MQTNITSSKSRTNSRSRRLEPAKNTQQRTKTSAIKNTGLPNGNKVMPVEVPPEPLKPLVTVPAKIATAVQPPVSGNFLPRAACDSRLQSPAKLKRYIGCMQRSGWVFTSENDSSSHYNFTYATICDNGIYKRVYPCQVIDYAKRMLPMSDVALYAGILPPNHELYAGNPPAHHPSYDAWMKYEYEDDFKAAIGSVDEACDLLEMYALAKNGFQEEAERIEDSLDYKKAAEQLVDGLELANTALRNMEAAKTVYSHVLHQAIPAVCDVGARNVFRFMAGANGPINLKLLCGWWDWNIQSLKDECCGDILYIVSNNDWSYVAGFADLEAAKTQYIEKALVPSREKIDRIISDAIDPAASPPATDDDDIPF